MVDEEPAICSGTTPSLGQPVEEGVLVDAVVMFAQTFRAVLVGDSEAITRLAAQTDELVTAPLHLEQPGRFLVIRNEQMTKGLMKSSITSNKLYR